MLLVNNLSIAKPGLCPSSIAPFTIAISLTHTELTIANCNLTRIANAAGYPDQLPPYPLPFICNALKSNYAHAKVN